MAFSRFTLDTSELDDATVGLDGSPFPMNATGASSLGGTSATASATVKRFATGTSSLGGTSSTATATVVVPAVASADLGGLDASAKAKARKSVSANADLGGLEASATTKVDKDVIASASLGGLDASATTKVDKSAIASADLGSLVGSATADINPPEPPVIPPSGSRWWKQPAAPVKKHEPPEQIVIEIPKPRRPLLVSAEAGSRLGGANIGALGSVTFSTLDDDAEVLLLV
jgi:hypothetical protein